MKSLGYCMPASGSRHLMSASAPMSLFVEWLTLGWKQAKIQPFSIASSSEDSSSLSVSFLFIWHYPGAEWMFIQDAAWKAAENRIMLIRQSARGML